MDTMWCTALNSLYIDHDFLCALSFWLILHLGTILFRYGKGFLGRICFKNSQQRKIVGNNNSDNNRNITVYNHCIS